MGNSSQYDYQLRVLGLIAFLNQICPSNYWRSPAAEMFLTPMKFSQAFKACVPGL